jgi:TatD DNase family protein
MISDSHAHLDRESYGEELEGVLERAWQAGVERILAVGLGAKSIAEALVLARGEPRLRVAAGIHPHQADLGVKWEGAGEPDRDYWRKWQQRLEAALEEIAGFLGEPQVVAVGEVGLDYHYHYSPPVVQRRLFRKMIRLSRSHRLPLVVHTRQSTADTIRILEEEGAAELGGVFHCFGGDEELLRAAGRMGFYLGLAGPITFKKADRLRELAGSIPLEKILVETDCPYLSPEPYRGQRNEPARVVEVIKTLAALRRLEPARVAEITCGNLLRLFRW